MRTLFVIGDAGLWAAARDLHARGHEVTVLGSPGTDITSAAGIHVYESRGAGWRTAYGVGRLLAQRNVELAVANDPRSLALLGRARWLHPSTAITALGEGDAERQLESARATHRRYGRAVFLDRDGTLMPEIGALGRPEAVRLMPGVARALRAVNAAHYELVVVSNQSAIGRGTITEQQVRDVNAALRRALRAEGVELSGIYVCPHRPEDACDCRKPLPGLLLQAASALGLSLKRSWLIGDSTRDTDAATAAGVRGILLESGWGGADPAAPRGASSPRRAPDIGRAVQLILRT
ncbi:MAG TPA: HAD family hydrolase [Candidatus Eisenbacteria bacterium]|nr:HAD family hydrolase [Candidatus Eisenbacteria bacterium]